MLAAAAMPFQYEHSLPTMLRHSSQVLRTSELSKAEVAFAERHFRFKPAGVGAQAGSWQR